MPISSPRHMNLRGAFWMICAMAGFAVEDALFKRAGQSAPLGYVLILFGLLGASLFAIWGRLRGVLVWHRDILSPSMLVRACFEIVGRLFFILAIVLTPLSSATVILQAAPLVVVAGAALVFGETVGPRRWCAVLLGLLGVVIVVNPSADSFTPLSALAVIGMLGLAGRDLASRAAPSSLSIATLGVTGFAPVVLAGLLLLSWTAAAPPPLSLHTGAPVLAAACAGVFAYGALMVAMRTGEVSFVTPFRYTRLLFGVGAGIWFFDEELSANMIWGGALILLSGLFIIWRSRAARDP